MRAAPPLLHLVHATGITATVASLDPKETWMKSILAVILLGALATTATAAEPRTEHTFQLAEGENRPAATIDDAGWLAGSWTGTAFGQRFEEVWNPPSAGTMVGCFKLFGDDGVEFYELLLLTVEEGSLSLKVKHFNADFTAWEEKADFVDFRLVKKEKNALHFGGLSFYRRGNDSMDGYIVMKHGDEVREHHLTYTRR
jgi:hypothetical protein